MITLMFALMVTTSSLAFAADPSPTLGSTNSPAANPPGSADGDRDDWSGMKWLPFGLLIPIVVAGGVIMAKRGDRRRND
ncbi:hypothetical protein AB0P21_41320 [Kribbella sp. NPDC056861]|uniref:hypothetical protein n=1 Tax=Kribbella sp. NPDC056861 TaxID=3154857 RepID=UPI003421B1D4